MQPQHKSEKILHSHPASPLRHSIFFCKAKYGHCIYFTNYMAFVKNGKRSMCNPLLAVITHTNNYQIVYLRWGETTDQVQVRGSIVQLMQCFKQFKFSK